MAETPATTRGADADQKISLTVPIGFHGIIYVVFYGTSQKEVEIVNVDTGETIAKQSSCYSGWHTCGVIPAIHMEANVEIRMRYLDVPCGAVAFSPPVPIALTSEVGGVSGNLVSHSYIYGPTAGGTSPEQFGITVVVQAGVGPIVIDNK